MDGNCEERGEDEIESRNAECTEWIVESKECASLTMKELQQELLGNMPNAPNK